MEISLEWLAEYLPGPLAAEAAGEALTHGGLPVEVYKQVGSDHVFDVEVTSNQIPEKGILEKGTSLISQQGIISDVPFSGCDTVFDVEVTSNRSDCLSHVGVARELSALLRREFRDVQPALKEIAERADSVTSVRIEAPALCPHYSARVIRNVKVGPSPAWMVRRLEAIGLRSINNIVDVTNYVLMELGQPLHAFDFDKLVEKRIVVRQSVAGEKIVSLDGKERALQPGMLVIADAGRPVAVAGIMGGLDTEVTLNTRNVLLESARFDPLSIRKTARFLAMKSDSSYRFERGIDPTLPLKASLRAAQLILQTAGGELLAGVVDVGGAYTPKTLSLRLSKIKQVLGMEIPAEEVIDALTRLQFSPRLAEDRIEVTVPPHRLDVNIEVDLVEEVARVIGYARIPVREEISIRVMPPPPDARTIEQMRATLVAGGYSEAVTFSFVSDALAGDFQPEEAASLMRADASVRKADAHLRPSILPGLLEAVRRNENAGITTPKLFEIGSTFWARANATTDERRQLGLVGSADLREVRGIVEAVLTRLDARRKIEVIPAQRKGFGPAACGRIEWGGTHVGYLGKIDRAIAEKLSLRDIPAAAELELAPLQAGAQHVPQLNPLPKFPAVRRDLSLVVTDTVRYQAVAEVIASLNLPQLEDVEFVTTYRGKPLEPGTKSITVTLVFRSATETLTGEAVDESVKRVVEAAKEKLAATQRV